MEFLSICLIFGISAWWSVVYLTGVVWWHGGGVGGCGVVVALPRLSGRDRTVKRIQHKSTYFSNSTKRKNVYTDENPHIKKPIFGRPLKMSNFF